MFDSHSLQWNSFSSDQNIYSIIENYIFWSIYLKTIHIYKEIARIIQQADTFLFLSNFKFFKTNLVTTHKIDFLKRIM